MVLDFLFDVFNEDPKKTAIIWNNEEYSYSWIIDNFKKKREMVKDEFADNKAIALHSDFSPHAVAMLLALIAEGKIIVPMSPAVANPTEMCRIAQTEALIRLNTSGSTEFEKKEYIPSNTIYKTLVEHKNPGLVLFSSGSTGEPKAAVHDFVPLLNKFKTRRQSLKTISFLLFDHIGGINTLLHVLSNLGSLVVPEKRTPDHIAELIEKNNVELLPTSPSFLNLLLMSGEIDNRDLSQLKIISYGTEPMPKATLKALHEKLPHVKLKQTYGLSELGIMRTKSRGSDSLWMKLGGEDYETRVVNGFLEIKAKTAMLGYLNAQSPFTDDGWFITGDKVEVDGEWMRILGRESDIINVGGEKVYPAEVESSLLNIDNVADASVVGKTNPLLGTVVTAKVVLDKPEDSKAFKNRMRKELSGKLESFKIPASVELVESLTSARYKRIRS